MLLQKISTKASSTLNSNKSYYIFFSTLPAYVQMLILMTIFLVVVIYHARLVEVTARLDFLWNLQASQDLDWMQDTQNTNAILLEHILPDHVVNHFLSKRRCPNVSVFGN